MYYDQVYGPFGAVWEMLLDPPNPQVSIPHATVLYIILRLSEV